MEKKKKKLCSNVSLHLVPPSATFPTVAKQAVYTTAPTSPLPLSLVDGGRKWYRKFIKAVWVGAFQSTGRNDRWCAWEHANHESCTQGWLRFSRCSMVSIQQTMTRKRSLSSIFFLFVFTQKLINCTLNQCELQQCFILTYWKDLPSSQA